MRAAAGASVRDRTAEFQQIVSRLAAAQGLPTTSGRDAPSTSAGGGSQSEFARRAARIGVGIHSTSQKLQKLAQLARRTGMFDDPAEEISELSTVVKQDIQVRWCRVQAGWHRPLQPCCQCCRLECCRQLGLLTHHAPAAAHGCLPTALQALNQAISDLQTFSGGGPNKQSADHSHTVVDNLRSRLKDATQVRAQAPAARRCLLPRLCSAVAHRPPHLHPPLLLLPLEQVFKDVLTSRTDNLKAHQERKSLFSAAPEGGVGAAARQPLFSQPGAGHRQREAASAASGVCSRGGGRSRSPAAHQPLLTACPPAGASFLPPNARNPLAVRGGLQGSAGDGSSESAPLLGGGGQQQQQALMAPATDQYLTSRAEALHQVGPGSCRDRCLPARLVTARCLRAGQRPAGVAWRALPADAGSPVFFSSDPAARACLPAPHTRWSPPSWSWAASSSSWRTWWRSRARWRCASTRTWRTRWATWTPASSSCSSTSTQSPPTGQQGGCWGRCWGWQQWGREHTLRSCFTGCAPACPAPHLLPRSFLIMKVLGVLLMFMVRAGRGLWAL